MRTFLLYRGILLILLGMMGFHVKTIAQDSLEVYPKPIPSLPQQVTVNNIFVIGNEKTKKNIILRELSIESGVTYDWEELLSIIQADQKKIYNLMLFNTVEITPLLTDTELIEVLISVKERWYIIPSLIFQLADRNLAEWWTNQNRDFSRVNIGAKLLHYNVAGRNEKLRVLAQTGFVQAYEIFYDKPYIDRKQKHGLALQTGYFTQKTLAVFSENNRQVFYRNENEETLRSNFSTALRYTYRGSFYNFHFLTLGFNSTTINNDVFQKNPNYFLHGENRLSYFQFGYSFRHDRRDNVSYATEGQLLNIGITKYGLGGFDDINDAEITLNANKYIRFGKKFHLATGVAASSFLRESQPYTLVRGLGYLPNFIRGYELNVVEGQQLVVHKSSFRFKLIDWSWEIGQYTRIEEFSYFPFKLFISANFDHGYVNDKSRTAANAFLSNQYLMGYGLGLDIVTLHDSVFRFEYSLTNKKPGAFFINFRAPL